MDLHQWMRHLLAEHRMHLEAKLLELREGRGSFHRHDLGGPPHPVIMTIRNNEDFGSYYIPIIPLLQGGGSS